MKREYILLEKEYCSEGLADIEQDISECHMFPKDFEYLKINNGQGMPAGIYKVVLTYIPNEKGGDFLGEIIK